MPDPTLPDARCTRRARCRAALAAAAAVAAGPRGVQAQTPAPPPRTTAEGLRADLAQTVPPPADGADTGWRGLLPPARAPWSLQDAGQPLRTRALALQRAFAVDLRQTHDTPHTRLVDFLDRTRAAIRQAPPAHLVLDLRLNAGGNLTQARDHAEEWPALVPVELFVLTRPWTFSAAISVAGYLKQAAPARVRIVGEPVGDRLEFFAEGRLVNLAHTGEVLLNATGRHDYVDGCRRFDDCHAPVAKRPIRVPHLAPAIEAPWTIEPSAAGHDPAMAALARVPGEGGRG